MLRAITVLLLAGLTNAAFVKFPYLQNLTDSTIVVRWETSAPQPGKVIYGFSPACEFEVVQPDTTVDHELTLPDLVPDTLYHYRAVSGADSSAPAQFRTIPGPDARFRLVVFGDPHGDSATNQRVADRIAATSPAPVLLASTGDLTASGRSAQWRALFNVYRPLLGRAPLFPAPGNHDFDSIPNWLRFLCLPGNELYYSFRYGGSSFHALNAYDSLVPGSSQYQWLLSELRRDSADPRVRHVFVLVHTPPYTTSTVYSGNPTIRTHLGPLFERYGVRIVFAGHVHAYEHSTVNGVRYITTGGAGASLAVNWNQAQPWTVYREAVFHFTLLDISSDTILCRGVRTDATEFDTLLIASPPTGAGEMYRAPARPMLAGAHWRRGALSVTVTLPAPALLRFSVYSPVGARVARWSCPAGPGATRLRHPMPDLPAGVYVLCAETAGPAPRDARTFFAAK